MIEYTVQVYEGKIKWYLNDKLHREDGPAIEYVEIGHRYWYLNGKKHREDGPAVEESNGHKEWWINNKFHREDGPAIEYANGDKFWYLNGEELTEKEFINRKSHKLVIDGKEMTLSNESFNELKKFFKGE